MTKKVSICGFCFCQPRFDCRTIVWLAASWLAWTSLIANAGAWDEPPEYLSASWRDHEGIPESQVTAVAQSSDGYLWVGTPDGLLRFNGITFSKAREFSELQRLHGVISFLQTDRSGRLWACGEGRLAC